MIGTNLYQFRRMMAQLLNSPEKSSHALNSKASSQDCESIDEQIEEDSPFLSARTSNRRPWSHSPLIFLFDALLVLACTFLVLHQRTLLHLDWQGDLTNFVPRFSQQIVTFQQHPEFISNHSSEASLAEAREFWKTIVPRGYRKSISKHES